MDLLCFTSHLIIVLQIFNCMKYKNYILMYNPIWKKGCSAKRPPNMYTYICHAGYLVKFVLPLIIVLCHEMLSRDFVVARRLAALVSFVMILELLFHKADLNKC